MEVRLTEKYDIAILFLLLPQALTKDKPLTILIPQCIFHNMFRLAPWSHGILQMTDWKIKHHKRRQLWGQLSLFVTKFIVVTHKDGKGLKTSTPQGLLSSPFSPPSPPSFPSPPSSSDPFLAEYRTPPSPSPWFPMESGPGVEDTSFLGWETGCTRWWWPW